MQVVVISYWIVDTNKQISAVTWRTVLNQRVANAFIHIFNFYSWHIVLFFIYLHGCVRPFHNRIFNHSRTYQLYFLKNSEHHQTDLFEVAIQLLVVTARETCMRTQKVSAKRLNVERWHFKYLLLSTALFICTK